MRLVYDCPSPECTDDLACALGRLTSDGLLIALTGPPGSGKTAFVQGLARGLEVPPEHYITSPTFALVNEYPGRLPLWHADLYRLGESADLEEIGLLERMGKGGVIAIEWAEHAEADLPGDRLTIHLEIGAKGQRRITLTAYGRNAENLLKRLARLPQGGGAGA